MKKSLLTLCAVSVLLSVFVTSCSEDDDDDSLFALVNIPNKEFFEAESQEFDALTTATQKTCNGGIAYSAYHKETEPTEAKIHGVTFPVKISESDLKNLGGKEITDSSSSFDITITGKGAGTTRYSGKQNLYQNEDYSYYILSEKPAFYKEYNGKSFSKIKGNDAKDLGTLYAISAASPHHADYEISLYTEISANEATSLSFDDADKAKTVTTSESGDETLTDKDLNTLKAVFATVEKDGNESTVGLTVLQNVWRGSQIGCAEGSTLDGATVKKLTFITEKGLYTASKFETWTSTKNEENSTTYAKSKDSLIIEK